jgi:hypothetical protein
MASTFRGVSVRGQTNRTTENTGIMTADTAMQAMSGRFHDDRFRRFM